MSLRTAPVVRGTAWACEGGQVATLQRSWADDDVGLGSPSVSAAWKPISSMTEPIGSTLHLPFRRAQLQQVSAATRCHHSGSAHRTMNRPSAASNRRLPANSPNASASPGAGAQRCGARWQNFHSIRSRVDQGDGDQPFPGGKPTSQNSRAFSVDELCEPEEGRRPIARAGWGGSVARVALPCHSPLSGRQVARARRRERAIRSSWGCEGTAGIRSPVKSKTSSAGSTRTDPFVARVDLALSRGARTGRPQPRAQFRGAYMITATPKRQMTAPVRSQRSG